jgi:hypothetical protein
MSLPAAAIAIGSRISDSRKMERRGGADDVRREDASRDLLPIFGRLYH